MSIQHDRYHHLRAPDDWSTPVSSGDLRRGHHWSWNAVTSITNSSFIGTLTLGGNITNAGNTLTIAGTGNTVLSGVLGSGSGGLTETGSGTLTISSNQTFTGIVTLSGGTLSISRDLNLGAAPGAATPTALTLNGGTLVTTGSGLAATPITLAANRGTTVSASSSIAPGAKAPLILQALAIGGFTLTDSGAGNLTVNGTTSLTGKQRDAGQHRGRHVQPGGHFGGRE